MQEFEDIKILFLAGFGPSVRDRFAAESFMSMLSTSHFEEEQGGYLHTEALPGARSFAVWPLDQAAQSCFGEDAWPENTPVPQAHRKRNVGIGVTRLSNARQEQVRRSHDFLPRTDCWLI